ncbi:phosphatase PAP2 family protein [Candidatus Peregrinibacteria bacterium]|nr:phosphatase PAP2 family protein [Candidatus Peregrinibacteria bacterium]
MEIKKLKIYLIAAILVVFFSFFFDEMFADLMKILQEENIISFMFFITDFGIVFLGALILAAALKYKKYRFLLFMCLTAIIAFETAFLLKLIFQVPRPYILESTDPVFIASGFAFPSIHTALMCSLLPYIKYIFGKKSRYFIYLFIGLIILSRAYLGVHTLSDIAAGGFIGLFSTYGLLAYEKKYHFITWFESQISDKLELRRQAAHMIIGVSIVFLLKLQLLNSFILFVAVFMGGILVLAARKIYIPVLHKILLVFERPHHIARFPGRGSFFLVLGAALTTFIFEKNIAMAAIMILAVGDSVTNIVGRYFGKITNPFNEKKKVEGTIIAVILSTLAALIFVPIWPAFLASFVSMFFESLDLGWKKRNFEVDDNIMIPLVAGIIITAAL